MALAPVGDDMGLAMLQASSCRAMRQHLARRWWWYPVSGHQLAGGGRGLSLELEVVVFDNPSAAAEG